jgi:malic enzyme
MKHPRPELNTDITLRGAALLQNPVLNKGTAFTQDERLALGLQGLLPPSVNTLAQQVTLEVEHIRRKHDDLEKFITLAALQNRNETLFYKVLLENLEEFMPIVYTPTVGKACQEYSHILRDPRGLWITPHDIDRIPEILRHVHQDARLIVVTDAERILGLGDQGTGGMGIPVGKLALYTAGAGIHPSLTLPITLDVGTDRKELLDDPLYLGLREPRLRGPKYDAFIEAFVVAVKEVFPHVLLQWEDFKQHNAIAILDRYRKRLCSFNDDVQGTAGVVCAGIFAAIRAVKEPISRQRVAFLGAGAAGTGIAALVAEAMRQEGASPKDIKGAIVTLDSKGLIYEGRVPLDHDKLASAIGAEEMKKYGFEQGRFYNLEEVVAHVHPTMLVGTAGTPGAFTEGAIREMAKHAARPIIFPLSNPTSSCEATPADVMTWTDGRAIVATGSPFAPVTYGGKTHIIGQANNVFIFPGVGLGAIVAEAKEVTDQMFLTAARALAEQVSEDRLATGALYPRVSELRPMCRIIAARVAAEARGAGPSEYAAIEREVEEMMWEPKYHPYHAV